MQKAIKTVCDYSRLFGAEKLVDLDRAPQKPHPEMIGSAIGLKVVENVPYIIGMDKFIPEVNEETAGYLKDLGAAPVIILAANEVAEAAIWKERTGEGQDIHVDLRKAWIEQSPWQLDAVPYTLVNGAHKMFNLGSYVVTNPIIPSRDGCWMVMSPLYPSQERNFLRLMNLRC